MSKKFYYKDSPLLEKILNEKIQYIFSRKKKANYDYFRLLFEYPPFLKRVANIRMNSKVPKLKIDLDMYEAGIARENKVSIVIESKWKDSLNDNQRARYDDHIKSLLSDYKIPSRFSDFIETFVLYNLFLKVPIISFDFILMDHYIENNTKLFGIKVYSSLTDKEKSLLSDLIINEAKKNYNNKPIAKLLISDFQFEFSDRDNELLFLFVINNTNFKNTAKLFTIIIREVSRYYFKSYKPIHKIDEYLDILKKEKSIKNQATKFLSIGIPELQK